MRYKYSQWCTIVETNGDSMAAPVYQVWLSTCANAFQSEFSTQAQFIGVNECANSGLAG